MISRVRPLVAALLLLGTIATATSVDAAPAAVRQQPDPAAPSAARTTLSMAQVAADNISATPAGQQLLKAALDAGQLSDGIAVSSQRRAQLQRDAVVIKLDPAPDASFVYISSTPDFELSFEGDLATAIREQRVEVNALARGTTTNATNGSVGVYPSSGWYSAGAANFTSNITGFAKFGSYEIRRQSAWHPTLGTNCGTSCRKYDAFMIKAQANALTGYSMRRLYANWKPATTTGANIIQALPDAAVRSGSTSCVTANISGTIGATAGPFSIGFSSGYTRQSCSPSEVTNGRIINTTTRETQTFWWKETTGGIAGARTVAGSSMTEIIGANFPTGWTFGTYATSTCCS